MINQEQREKIFTTLSLETQRKILSLENIFWITDFSDEPHMYSVTFYEMIDDLNSGTIYQDDIKVFDDYWDCLDYFNTKRQEIRDAYEAEAQLASEDSHV